MENNALQSIEVDLPGELNYRQRRFVIEYLKDGNGTKAAERAGYSKKTSHSIGCRLLSMGKIKRQLADKAERHLAAQEVDLDYLVFQAKKVTERCTQDVRPVLDRRGEQVMVEDQDGKLCPAFTFDAQGALRGVEVLGKLRQFTQDAAAANTQVNVTVNMEADEATRIYTEYMGK